MPSVIEMTRYQSDACETFCNENLNIGQLAREQENFIKEVEELEKPTYITHPHCQRNLKDVMNPYADGDGDGAWLGSPGKTIPTPPQVYHGKIASLSHQDYQFPTAQYNNAWPGQCFPQFPQLPQEHAVEKQTQETVPLGDLMHLFVLHGFLNTQEFKNVLGLLDDFFTGSHFITGKIRVFQSIQRKDIVYLCFPRTEEGKMMSQAVLDTSWSLKDDPRKNGEKWPKISYLLKNADLSQMTIPLN